MAENGYLGAFQVSLAFIVVFCIISVLAVLLNIVEIHLIRQKWKKATYFEVILLNLAVADIITGFTGLAKTGIFISIYNKNTNGMTLLAGTCLLMIFPLISSALFVSIIGMERLGAVKFPLKHRYRTSSRRTTIIYIVGTWVLTGSITVITILCSVFLMDDIRNVLSGETSPLTLGFAIFLLVVMVLIILLYMWIAQLVVKRNSWFFKFNKETSATKSFIATVQKERATIVVCILVIISYVALNIPMVVAIFRNRFVNTNIILMNLNSVTNPLIYFFKGYVEKRFAKQKMKFVSSEVKERNVTLERRANTGSMETIESLAT